MKLKRFTSVLLSIGPVLYLITIGVVTGGQMIAYTINDVFELLTSEQALKCSCKPNFIERCTEFLYDWKNPTCCAFCRHAPLPRCDCSEKGVAKCYDDEGDLSESLKIVPRRCCLVCSAMAKFATEPPPATDSHTISTVAPTCVQSCLDRKFGGDLAKCYFECWRRYGQDVGRDPDTGKYPPKGALVMSFTMLYRYEVIIMLTIRSLQVFAHTSLVLFVILHPYDTEEYRNLVVIRRSYFYGST
uniref:Uncharacterized protein n=2 Tax=Lygus hesperus TaxID=30085 RepID=A0A0K8S4L3_LYGHE